MKGKMGLNPHSVSSLLFAAWINHCAKGAEPYCAWFFSVGCGGLFLSRCESGGILALGPRKTASQAIDVFKKIGRNILPQRIKDKLDALSPSHLGCWNEIRVARNKHDDLGLVFESDRSNVEADPHVVAFLAQRRSKIVVGQILSCPAPREDFSLRLCAKCPKPVNVFSDLSQSDRKIGDAVKNFKQFRSKARLLRLGIVNCSVTDWGMSLLIVRPGIVVERSVQKLERVGNVLDLVQLFQVTLHQLFRCKSYDFRNIGIDIRPNDRQSSQKETAIDEYCNFDHAKPIRKSSMGLALLMIANPVFRTEARRTAMERIVRR